jgi:hypothetical protein
MRVAVLANEARRQGYEISIGLRGDQSAREALLTELPGAKVDMESEAWRPVDSEAKRLLIDAPSDISEISRWARVHRIPTLVLDRLDVLDEAGAAVLPVLHAPTVTHPRLFQSTFYLITAPALRGVITPYDACRSLALVTLGGADPLQLTLPLTRALFTASAEVPEAYRCMPSSDRRSHDLMTWGAI